MFFFYVYYNWFCICICNNVKLKFAKHVLTETILSEITKVVYAYKTSNNEIAGFEL